MEFVNIISNLPDQIILLLTGKRVIIRSADEIINRNLKIIRKLNECKAIRSSFSRFIIGYGSLIDTIGVSKIDLPHIGVNP